MYLFYEVAIHTIKSQNEVFWSVLTFESSDLPIVEMFLTQSDAEEQKDLRLSEGLARMKRYSEFGKDIAESSFEISPWFPYVEKFIERNNFMWKLDLRNATFESKSCTRLTDARLEKSLLAKRR